METKRKVDAAVSLLAVKARTKGLKMETTMDRELNRQARASSDLFL